MDGGDDVSQTLAKQLYSLRDRFSRIAAGADDGESEVEAASAWGGKLVAQIDDAGLLPFGLPKPTPRDAISDDDSGEWRCLWQVTVVALSHGLPGHFPSNPSHIQWSAPSDGAEQVRTGTIRKADWRIRAENYSTVCEVLANLLNESPTSPPEPLTDDQKRVFDYIRDNGPVQGKTICAALGIDNESSLTKHLIPPTKKHGVKNKRGAGYYIP
jgi:hypothetical protein